MFLFLKCSFPRFLSTTVLKKCCNNCLHFSHAKKTEQNSITRSIFPRLEVLLLVHLFLASIFCSLPISYTKESFSLSPQFLSLPRSLWQRTVKSFFKVQIYNASSYSQITPSLFFFPFSLQAQQVANGTGGGMCGLLFLDSLVKHTPHSPEQWHSGVEW